MTDHTRAIEAGARADLLPCPFCGGTASIERRGSVRQSNIVACDNCGCRVESGDAFDPTRSWNCRATGSLVPASAVADMRERCAAYHDALANAYEVDTDRIQSAANIGATGDAIKSLESERTSAIESRRYRIFEHRMFASAIRSLDLPPTGGNQSARGN